MWFPLQAFPIFRLNVNVCKNPELFIYIEFLCVIAREKYVEANVCLGKYIFA